MTKFINKNILILLAVLVVFISPAFASYCYQEFANQTNTSCFEVLSNGSYNFSSPPFSTNPYFYVNYSKPVVLPSTNTSLFQILYYGTGGIAKNLSFPMECYNQSLLQFRVYTWNGFPALKTGVDCYNGSTWLNMDPDTTTAAQCGGSPTSGKQNNIIDGNWSTWAQLADQAGGCGGTGQWSDSPTDPANAFIYEEAMWWDIPILKIDSCQVLNVSGVSNYTLSNSFSAASASGACLNITASNVTINGNGSVIANGTSSVVGIYINGTNVTLANFTMINMSRYIQTTGSNVTIRNFTITNENGTIIFAPLQNENFTLNGEMNSSTFALRGGIARNNNTAFNTTANITLKFPQFTNVNRIILLKDSSDNGTFSICSFGCNYTTLSSGNLTFNVTGWTTYGAIQVDMNQTPEFDVYEYSNRIFYMNISGVNISSTSAVLNYNGTEFAGILTLGNSTLREYEVNATVPGPTSGLAAPANNISWYWSFNTTFLNGSFQGNSTMLEATNSTVLGRNLTLNYRYEGNLSNITDGLEIWISNTTNVTYWGPHLGNYSTWNFSQIAHENNIDLRLRFNGYERHYFVNLTNSSINMTVYFGDPMYWFTFLTKTSSDQLLPDTTLTIQRLINVTYTTIAQSITDAGAQAIIPLESNITYRIIASHTDFVTSTSDTLLVYIINPANTIYLTPVNVTVIGPYINQWVGNATIHWNPWDYIIYYNTSANCTVAYTFVDTESLTLNFTANITYRGNHSGNVTNYNFYDIVSNSFTRTNLLNISPASYTFHMCVNRTTGSTSALYCQDKLYICSRISGIGSWNAPVSEAAGGLSVTTWKLLTFLVLAIITGAAIKFAGIGAILVLAIGVGIAGWFGIFNILETALMILLCIAILRLVH